MKCKICGKLILATIEGEPICSECWSIRQLDDEGGRPWTAEELLERGRLAEALLGKQVAEIDGQPVRMFSWMPKAQADAMVSLDEESGELVWENMTIPEYQADEYLKGLPPKAAARGEFETAVPVTFIHRASDETFKFTHSLSDGYRIWRYSQVTGKWRPISDYGSDQVAALYGMLCWLDI